MALAIGSDLPSVGVVYTDMSYVASGSGSTGPADTLTALANVVVKPVQKLFGSAGTANKVEALKSVSGRLRPGTATLILSSAGGGSSTLMRLIAGRQTPTSGQLLWNHRSADQLKAEGVSMRKLAAFCSDADENEALFTVLETLNFAYQSAIVPVAEAETTDDPRYYTPLDAPFMVKQLGLEESKNTIIGNALLRGISGGQKRRVSVGETLIQNARITCLDGPTNGLDAVTATEVMSFAVEVAHRTGGILVASLAAPLPETANLFDDVILLADGRVLYHGPYNRMDDYLSSLGFERPSYMDSAEWAVQITSSPLNAALLLIEDCKKEHAGSADAPPAPCFALLSRLPALTVDALADQWDKSTWKANMMAGLAPPVSNPSIPIAPSTIWKVPDASEPMLTTWYAQAQYGTKSSSGFWSQVALTTKREFTLMKRNWLYTGARLANALFMGIILGLVFLQLEVTEWFLFYSCSLFALTFVSFLNNAIVPIAMSSRLVVYKQTSAGLYNEWAYNLAVLAGHLPISIVADVTFATVLYFIVGFASNGGRWIFFCLIVLLMDLAISTLYRSFSYVAANQEVAMIVSSLFTAVGLSTGGFFVVRSQVPDYLVWILYISPFFWSVNSAANNEFSDNKYTDVAYPLGGTQGQAFMSAFAYLDGVGWQWLGIGVLLAYYLFFGLVAQPLLLKLVRYEIVKGTQRLAPESNQEAEALVKQALGNAALVNAGAKVTDAVVIPTKGVATKGGPIPFTPVTLAFKDIHYSVQLKASAKDKANGSPATVTKQLLRGVSGFARPGDLVALCGASGAGKTTLLDVLSSRKTTGTITGQILLNGKPSTPTMISRASAFAEQADAHIPTTTLREALEFSVALRADPANVPTQQARKALIDDILETLELTRIADRSVSTLSSGELKRLSLGVELTANTGLLFADEPTTGLSARAASVVVRCLKKIASQGKTVVCTIHQPPSALFFEFSHLVLLAPGGYQVFFGEIGHHGHSLVSYFEAIPDGYVPRLPPHHNPASYMLDVLLMTPKKTAANLIYHQTSKPGHTVNKLTSTSVAAEVAPVAADAGEEPSAEVESSVAAAVAMTHHEAFPGMHAAPHSHPSDNKDSTPQIKIDVPSDAADAPDTSKAAGTGMASPPGDVDVDSDGAFSPTPDAPDHHALEVEREAIAEVLHHQELMTAPDFANSYKQSALYASNTRELDAYLTPGSAASNSLTFSSSYARGYLTQVFIVLKRALKDSWRNSGYTANRILAGAVQALFFGLLYSELQWDTFAGVQSAMGAVLAAMGFQGVLFFSIGVPLYIRYRPALYRERDAHFYDISAQALATLIVETMWTALLTIIFVAIFYPLIGFKSGFSNYGFFTLGAFITILSFVFAAVAAAAMFPSAIVAQLAGGVFLSVVFLFASIFVPYSMMPVGWLWMMQTDFAFHLTRALAVNQFRCTDAASGENGCQTVQVTTPMGPWPMQVSDLVNGNFDGSYEGTRWKDIGIGAGILGGFVLATFVLWKKVNWTKR